MMELDDRTFQVQHTYQEWLESLVGTEWYGLPYTLLLERLFRTEYFWTVPNDENRAADGLALREEFVEYFPHFFGDEALVGPPCVMEVLVALARRVDFEVASLEDSGMKVVPIFWKMLENLKLLGFHDERFSWWEIAKIDEILMGWMENSIFKVEGRVVWFSPFWNENPDFDPQKTEIWAQMHRFLTKKPHFV